MSTALVAVAAAGAGRLVEASQAAAAEAPAVQRTSSLSAPILQLSGHKGTVYSNQFSPDGTKLAASCSDGSIYMWSVFGEDGPQNYQSIPVHKLDALQVVWSPDGESLVSAGADCLGVVTDVETATRVKGLRHRSFVNSVAVAKQSQLYVLTGSDDKKACLWDIRQREPATVIPHKFQVTAVALSADANVAYAGGIDEIVRAFDARTGKELFALEGHKNTITGLALNADGTVLASNAMDGVAKCWDVRRFLSAERAAQGRCIADLTGHTHDSSQQLLRVSFSPDGRSISTGSADGMVNIWNALTGDLTYKLPGHRGSVNEVVFHPTEPIIASCSNDKSIYLGELAQ